MPGEVLPPRAPPCAAASRPWKARTSVSSTGASPATATRPATAASPSSRASRSTTVPPSRCASRSAGGNDGSDPSYSRRLTAGRACAVWPERYCAAPRTSHAQRSRRARASRGLLARIASCAYSAAGASSSISREPGRAGRALLQRHPARARAPRRGPASRRCSAATPARSAAPRAAGAAGRRAAGPSSRAARPRPRPAARADAAPAPPASRSSIASTAVGAVGVELAVARREVLGVRLEPHRAPGSTAPPPSPARSPARCGRRGGGGWRWPRAGSRRRPTASASRAAVSIATCGSRRNVMPPTGESSTFRRPGADRRAAAGAARAADGHRARLGRDDGDRRLERVRRLRAQAVRAEPAAARGDLGDPVEDLRRRQLAVAARRRRRRRGRAARGRGGGPRRA